jgi:hypothetical protein
VHIGLHRVHVVTDVYLPFQAEQARIVAWQGVDQAIAEAPQDGNDEGHIRCEKGHKRYLHPAIIVCSVI